MRHAVLFVMLFCCSAVIHAQKNGQAAKTKTSKAAAKQPVNQDISAALIFDKAGKVQVSFNGFDYFADEPLQKHKELMYFLLERFTAAQVRKIMAISRKPYPSYPYDISKTQYSKLNGYIIKAWRSYYKPEQFQNMALVYLPYEENAGDDVPELLRIKNSEGIFLLMPLINLYWAGMPLLEKWEEQPIEKLPNFTAGCSDLLYTNENPAPAPEPAKNITGNNKSNSELAAARTLLNSYITRLSAAVKSYAKMSEALNSVDRDCWENRQTNSRAATLSYNSYDAWYSTLDELKQSYAALEKLNNTRFAPFCKEWASIELKITEAKNEMSAFINTERASGILKRMRDGGKSGSSAEIWMQTVKEMTTYRDGTVRKSFEDFANSAKKINDLSKQCGN